MTERSITKRRLKGLSKLELVLLSHAIRGFIDPSCNSAANFTDKGILRLLQIDDRIGNELLNTPVSGPDEKKANLQKLKKFREFYPQ